MERSRRAQDVSWVTFNIIVKTTALNGSSSEDIPRLVAGTGPDPHFTHPAQRRRSQLVGCFDPRAVLTVNSLPTRPGAQFHPRPLFQILGIRKLEPAPLSHPLTGGISAAFAPHFTPPKANMADHGGNRDAMINWMIGQDALTRKHAFQVFGQLL